MDLKTAVTEVRAWLGIERNATSHGEKWISMLGALLGIQLVYWVSLSTFEPGMAQVLLVSSMGASAVLLFAVPHGALSQPWALFGGHLISAAVGVTCQRWLGDYFWAGAFAVGAAVGAMYYLRCIHPPGGATALVAVIGGVEVHQLGYAYLVNPILLNTLVMGLVAVLFNGLFPWRRYPVRLSRRQKVLVKPQTRQFELTQEDFAAAMQQLDSYVDITTEGLTDLLELAKQHAERNVIHPEEIIAGRFYSNGKLGGLWSIRQVVDAVDHVLPSKNLVIYKVLAGDGAYDTGMSRRDEFQQWARYEVELHNGRWVKVQPQMGPQTGTDAG